MLRSLAEKVKEAALSVFPVSLIIFLLNLFTPLVNFSSVEMTAFLVSSVFLIIGMSLFNLGADLSMSPMGKHIGSGLSKTKKLWLIFAVCFSFGLLVTVAEPDLSVLAAQVEEIVDPTVLTVFVGVGVGVLLLCAVIKIVFHKQLSATLIFFYMIVFALSSLLLVEGKGQLIPLSMDSGGVTTGPVTVPFVMALGVGIATSLGGNNTGENSFGLIALSSVGPIISVMLVGLFSKGTLSYSVPDYSLDGKLGGAMIGIVFSIAKEVTAALLLVVLFFLVLQFFILKLPPKKIVQIFVGVAYTFVGLVIFLTAVNVGFMPIGYKLGNELVITLDNRLIVVVGFVLGAVTVLAEPAVHVLNKQVEEITNGLVKKRSMLISLSLGVGLAIALSMLRIIYDIDIVYVIVPGYLISLGLSFFVPGIYTAIAFDSGGVASGPLTSGFILPFAIGICYSVRGQDKILSDGFGIVALVALTPLITIQLLGFKAIITRKIKHRLALRRILSADDEQIINFRR